MRTLLLDKVNVGSHPDEIIYFEQAKQFHECQLEMADDTFAIFRNGNKFFETELILYEQDQLTKTHRGVWENGKRFRIVQPSDNLKALFQSMGKEHITIGSMFSDGYAVTFLLGEEQLTRKPTKGIMNSLLDGSNNPPKDKLVFHSNTHQRYEHGQPVRGEQIGCHRDVIIEKNISGGIGYTISVQNPDAIPGSWGATPMGTKPMKIESVSNDRIEMHGYGYDSTALAMGIPMCDATFENYGMTVYHDGKDITHCVIHLIERNVDIDYYVK